MSARAGVLAAIAAVTLTASCGGITAPDLFIVQRTGSVPGARLTLLVNEEGGVRCNGGASLKLSDPALVQARAIQEDLHGPASKPCLAAGAGGVRPQLLRARRKRERALRRQLGRAARRVSQPGAVRAADGTAGLPSAHVSA